MTDLRELRERIAGLEGPDREVDGMLCVLVEGRKLVEGTYLPSGTRCWLSRNPNPPFDEYVVWAEKIGGDRFNTANYTASIDAALGLVERAEWRVHFIHFSPDGGASVYVCEPNNVANEYEAEAKTAPLAILLALLDALISQNTEAAA